MKTANLTKFVGGVAEIEISSITNIVAPEGTIINEESLFRDPLLIDKIDIVEDKSSYDEQVNVENGVSFMRHTIKIALKRGAASSLAASFASKYIDGVVAIVTTMAGERLLVGVSAKFGTEHPLHPIQMGFDTGLTPKEYPLCILTLQCHATESAKTL